MAAGTMPPEAASPILRATGLRKSFGALAAVDDLSFDVWPGQIFGIAGPNGSGKSTLFNILTAIPFRPDAGQVIFAGRSLAGMPPHRIARSGLVRSFQKDATFDTLSARQTVGVAGYHGSARGSAATAETERLLDLVHFPATRRDEASGSLPIFDKKRLAIASALALNPRLLLLDEPASGLTKPEISDLRQLILGVRDHGVTIMLVEHVLSLLLAVSDSLFVMNNGRDIAHGKPEAVIREPAVVEAYLGRRAPA
jgi:branched-chain amino acid transport system ATP-binding protein